MIVVYTVIIERRSPLIKVGQKVIFNPFEDIRGYGIQMVSENVVGVVNLVNKEHQWFSVEYGDPKQRICFKFDDIGVKVTLV